MATLTMLYVTVLTDIVDTGHGLSLDDLERLNVKVTNGTVTAIGMWGYTPVGLTGVLVKYLSSATISLTNSEWHQQHTANHFYHQLLKYDGKIWHHLQKHRLQSMFHKYLLDR